jgi:hypothetical protein
VELNDVLDDEGTHTDDDLRRRSREEEHCSMMNGSDVFVSKKLLSVLTSDSTELIKCEIRSQHRPIASCKLHTNDRESEPNVSFIHEHCSMWVRADAAQALIAEIGFEIDSMAASQASLPCALLMKQSRAEKVSLHKNKN